VSEATISELTSRAEATGDAAAIADAQRAAALHDATKQMPAVAIGAQEEMVADAQQALSDALDPDDLELANDILKARESILANTRKALTTDQVSYVNGINGEAGVVDFDDIVAAATGDPMMSSPDNVLARRRQVIEMFAGANGNAQPLYFSKTEAQKFSDFFTDPNTPLADRLAFMTGVQNVFGPRADKVFAQLDDGKALMWAQAAFSMQRGTRHLLATCFKALIISELVAARRHRLQQKQRATPLKLSCLALSAAAKREHRSKRLLRTLTCNA
jgi:hypothetical protein